MEIVVMFVAFIAGSLTVGWVDAELLEDLAQLKAEGYSAEEADKLARAKPGKIFNMTRGQQHDLVVTLVIIIWVILLIKAIQMAFRIMSGS